MVSNVTKNPPTKKPFRSDTTTLSVDRPRAPANHRSYPASVAWALDYDYLHKLTENEKAWLSDFNEGHYGASKVEGWSKEEMRSSYAAKNSANRDGYTRWRRVAWAKQK